MKSICIIGYGYIGSCLYENLKNLYNITCISKSKTNCSYISKTEYKQNFLIAHYETLPSKFYDQFDIIILTAGLTKSGTLEDGDTQFIYKELFGYSYLVHILKPDQKLIYMSSAAVYGDTENKVVDENSDIFMNSGYDVGKSVRDFICNENKKEIYGLRLGTVSGWSPRLRDDLVLNKMYVDSVISNNITVSKSATGGFINRSLLGVSDLVKAIIVIIERGDIEKSGVYNISSFNTNINEISEQFNKPKTVYQSKTEYNFHLDNSKFCNNFDFVFTDTFSSILSTFRDKPIKPNKEKDISIKQEFTLVKKCRCCGTDTVELLDLGYQPLANSYHHENENLNYYPLVLHYCNNCFHVQLNCVVDPSILFSNYLYVSGTSKTNKDYFDNFAKNAISDYIKFNSDETTVQQTNPRVLKVLDIACNDGSQLDSFKMLQKGDLIIETTGVDPATNLTHISSRNHTVYCDFFNDDLLQKLESEYDIIIAQNVFAHVDNPKKFLINCKKLMGKNSVLYIQTSQANMIINGEFDTAYHEHLSFFNTNSMKNLCDLTKMYLNKVDLVDIHGKSYLFEIRRSQVGNSNVTTQLVSDIENNLYCNSIYNTYNTKCKLYKHTFVSKLLQYKLDGFDIISFGSTAKFNTLLNYSQISSDVIRCIIDENELKIGLLTPGSNIPIVSIGELNNLSNNTVIVISAWNYYDEIKNKIIKYMYSNNIHLTNIKLLNINPFYDENLNI